MIQRLYELERLIEDLRARHARLESRLAAAEQSTAKVWSMTWVPSGGGNAIAYWAVSGGSGIAAATGTWPSLSPGSDTLDVYNDVGGTLTLVTSGATCRWFYPDACGGDKLLSVVPNGDGSYDIVTESCSAVSV